MIGLLLAASLGAASLPEVARDGFLARHAIPPTFADPDWRRGVAEARAIYADFVRRGQPVPRGVVALDYPATDGNQVELEVGVEASWRAILGSIRDARQSVNITMIGWQVDELVPFHQPEVFGFELIDTLCEAARRGVSVNVAVNDMWFKQKGWFLTGGFDRQFDRAIKKGRCQDASGKKLRYVRGIAWHRSGDFVVGRYDHRKLWIIDGRVAYVGGYTVSDEMRENMFDAEWELRGPVVAQLQANFLLSLGYAKAPLADFTECASELGPAGCPEVGADRYREAVDRYFPQVPAAAPGAGKRLQIVQNNPLLEDPEALGVTRFYRQLIGAAREHLQLSSPFFTSDAIVNQVLEQYADAGCRLQVDVLFPQRPEHMMIWGKKGRAEMKRLVLGARELRDRRCGGEGQDVEVWAFRGDGGCQDYGREGRLHGKVLLTDDYVSIGSANLDGVSLERNLELNVVSADRDLVQRVNRGFFVLGASPECAEPMQFPVDARAAQAPARREIGRIDKPAPAGAAASAEP